MDSIKKPPARSVVGRFILAISSLVALLTATLAIGASTPALASATGCSTFGTVHAGNYTIPGGYFCGSVQGFSTYIESVAGSASSAGNICNWRIEGDFYDLSGRQYWTTSSGVHYSCTRTPSDGFNLNRWAQSGRLCIVLVSSGVRVAQVCHSIVQ